MAGSGFLTIGSRLVTRRNWLCAVDDGKHVDLVRLDLVDDAEGAFHYLPDLRDPEFQHFASGQGELSDLLRASGQPVNNAQGIFRGVPCNVGVDCAQMVARRVGPMNFHFSRPNSARSVSTLVVRPA